MDDSFGRIRTPDFQNNSEKEEKKKSKKRTFGPISC